MILRGIMLSTKYKIAIARLLSRIVCTGRALTGKGTRGVFTRGGLTYELDLQEGIDLSVYLFGAFEADVVAYYKSSLRKGSVALDIGANIGAHTLRMASLVETTGRVVAIEPTDWAFAKLTRNVKLNPDVAPQIKCVQGFVAAEERNSLPDDICSSWPLSDKDAGGLDSSMGRAFPTTGARVVTLGRLCEEFSLSRIDLIKIDVDGNEIEVLEGGLELIRQFHPTIIIELAPYVFTSGESDVLRIIELLAGADYRTARHGRTELPLSDPAAIISRIPKDGGINVLVK